MRLGATRWLVAVMMLITVAAVAAVPWHGHHDQEDHPDCQICRLAVGLSSLEPGCAPEQQVTPCCARLAGAPGACAILGFSSILPDLRAPPVSEG